MHLEPAVSRPQPKPRSRYAARRKIHGVDLRTTLGRDLAQLIDGYADPLGGRTALSEIQWSLVQQLAATEIELRRLRSQVVNVDILGGSGGELNDRLRLSAEFRRLETLLYGPKGMTE